MSTHKGRQRSGGQFCRCCLNETLTPNGHSALANLYALEITLVTHFERVCAITLWLPMKQISRLSPSWNGCFSNVEMQGQAAVQCVEGLLGFYGGIWAEYRKYSVLTQVEGCNHFWAMLQIRVKDFCEQGSQHSVLRLPTLLPDVIVSRNAVL
uniref:Uncharacterized protein n=1 Tax=Sphaerodactylus townsendi TaxID=933632 RepID=A0ACB8ECG4_9SAUR